MKQHPQYTFEPDGCAFRIIRWKRYGSGRVGITHSDHWTDREAVRREVYRLNGWKWKEN